MINAKDKAFIQAIIECARAGEKGIELQNYGHCKAAFCSIANHLELWLKDKSQPAICPQCHEIACDEDCPRYGRWRCCGDPDCENEGGNCPCMPARLAEITGE